MLAGLLPVHGNLLGNDVALLGHRIRFKNGVLEEIQQNIHKPGKGLSWTFNEKSGVILRGVCIHAPPCPFHIPIQSTGAAAFGALENHMLREMGQSSQAGGIMPPTNSRPDTSADTFHPRHFRKADRGAPGEVESMVICHEYLAPNTHYQPAPGKQAGHASAGQGLSTKAFLPALDLRAR